MKAKLYNYNWYIDESVNLFITAYFAKSLSLTIE